MDFPIEPRRIDHELPSEHAKFQDRWVPYPIGIEAVRSMAALIKRPHEGRPQNLALIGDPNDGKSHLLDYFVDRYPDLSDEEIPRVQILAVDMPTKADGAALVREMLRATGAPFNARSPLDILIDKLCVRCESLRVLMYVIDEFHNASWGRLEASKTVLQTVRTLSNRLRRPFVIAGTRSVNDVLRNDPQLNERFRKVYLPRWTEVKDLQELLATFETILGLPEPSELGTAKMAESVLEIAGPKIGRIAVLVRESARLAKEKGANRIGQEHLAMAEGLLPGSKM